MKERLGEYLERLVCRYNAPEYVDMDPVSIPHSFSRKQDIEIAGFFAATMAWGRRATIIKKAEELMALMDYAPHDFVLNHEEEDLKALLEFKHRTFQPPDVLYFIDFLHRHYQEFESLEEAFLPDGTFTSIEDSLICFHNYFCAGEFFLPRTRKHVPTPARKSACKRLNMFLRWMVRKDEAGVDFGLWQRIPQSELVCPCDVHVLRVAFQLGLLKEERNEWKTALKLTQRLKALDAEDPVRYDFALFNLGLQEDFRV